MTAATNPNKSTLIGLGEVLWDLFDDDRRPGGAPANVAFHAHQLGLEGLVASRVGTDDLGEELLDYFAAHRLDTRLVQRDREHPTGTVTVHHADAGPAYTIHENVAWDHLAETEELLAACEASAAVCFGTLAQRCASSRATIRACLDAARSAWRVYDVNLRPPHFDRATIDASLQLCHVGKLNHEELPQLAELLGVPATDPREQMTQLRERYNLKLLCMTRGGQGCLVAADEGFVDVPGRRVQVADTVGAGDAFTAAFAAGLVAGWPVAACANLANAFGGLVASHAGAMPQVRDEAGELWQQFCP